MGTVRRRRPRPDAAKGSAKARAPVKAAEPTAAQQAELESAAAMREYRQGRAMQRFRKEQPQFWLQAQRLARVLELQHQIAGNVFPAGCCFLHANLVGVSHVCVKQIREVNLETCQVTIEIHGDDNLEEGIVIIPLETIEWFGFPTKAVPVGVHFKGFAPADAIITPQKDPPPAAPGG